jgi:hypothetical protein
MTARIASLCLVGALCLAGAARADTLLLDNVDEARAETSARPSRGMTMKGVQDRFGAPVRAKSPVGDPPITTWEYSEFLVYFEYDRVIHAVSKPQSYNRS